MKLWSHTIFVLLILFLGLHVNAEISFDIDPPKTDSSKSISTDTVGINLNTDISKAANDDTLVFEDWEHPLKQREDEIINSETPCDGKARPSAAEIVEASNQEYYSKSMPQSKTMVQQFAELVIYPNPVQNTLTIDGVKDIQHIYILNFKGEMLKSVANSTQINVSELLSGVYLVRIESSEGLAVKKFIKH